MSTTATTDAAPEALEDSEYVDFSPTAEFQPVIDHLTGGAAASWRTMRRPWPAATLLTSFTYGVTR